jgi:hypothetical protein
MECRAIIRGVPGLHAVSDRSMIGRSAPWLSIVVHRASSAPDLSAGNNAYACR